MELPSRGEALKIQQDLQGRLLILYRLDNELHLHRITSWGHTDTSFGEAGDVLLPGDTRSWETYAQLNLYRNQPIVAATTGISESSTSVFFLNEDGTLDERFGDGGSSVFDWGLYGERVQDLIVMPDASLLLGVQTRDDVNAFGLIAKLEGVENLTPLHNFHSPVNVSAPFDGQVSPFDALLVIDYLNHIEQRSPTSDDPLTYGFVDVSGDGVVSPLDALLVIDHLNHQTGKGEWESEAEGESAWAGSLSGDVTGIPMWFWFHDAFADDDLVAPELTSRSLDLLDIYSEFSRTAEKD